MDFIGFASSPCFPHHQPSNSHSHCVSQRRGPGPPAGCHLRRGHQCHTKTAAGENHSFSICKTRFFLLEKTKRPKINSFPFFKPQKQVGSRRHRYVYSVLHNLLTCFKYKAKHVITSLFSGLYCYMALPGPPMAPHGPPWHEIVAVAKPTLASQSYLSNKTPGAKSHTRARMLSS